MRRILVVHPDLVKALKPAEGRELTTREKMIMILQDRIASEVTDLDRQSAERELKDYVGA